MQINSLIDRHEKIQNEICATITNTVAVLRNDFRKQSVGFEKLFEARSAKWEKTHTTRLQTVLDWISTPDEKTMNEIKTELEAIKEKMVNQIYSMNNDLCVEIRATCSTIAELERSLTEELESVT